MAAVDIRTGDGRHIAVIEDSTARLELELTDEPLSAYADLMELLFRPRNQASDMHETSTSSHADMPIRAIVRKNEQPPKCGNTSRALRSPVTIEE